MAESTSRLVEALMANSPEFRSKMIELGVNNPGMPTYFNNPMRAPLVQGGIAARQLFGLDPTDQQRLEDAFFQFPTSQYGKVR